MAMQPDGRTQHTVEAVGKWRVSGWPVGASCESSPVGFLCAVGYMCHIGHVSNAGCCGGRPHVQVLVLCLKCTARTPGACRHCQRGSTMASDVVQPVYG